MPRQRARHTKSNGRTPAPQARSPAERAAARAPLDMPVVALGASAGGLEAFQNLLDALPADHGMAFVAIQHLDPTHESLMVDLLARHTPMTVRQAANGMQLEPDCLYIIPPGAYLSVEDGALHLSKPRETRGARLPFDFLLRSLAEDMGERAICVILSGTGADGTTGAKNINERGGLVIAQDPGEAAYDGMPRSAIMSGVADLVLKLSEIPPALLKYQHRKALLGAPQESDSHQNPPDWLPEIVGLLREKTSHDFSHYKPGTLRRRIERRMAMAPIESNDINHYLHVLRNDPDQLDLLAKDLLINVTGFFRDPEVFDFLAEKVVPDLVRDHSHDNPIRIWVPGCSTGEEVYSLAILFNEQIQASKHNVKLQIFASDIDSDAVDVARDGFYPAAIEEDVSPDLLSRFFTKDGEGYRISPNLRRQVVFTVQDVLSDPPFSRLDLVSCRNLLIYLQPDAQAKTVALFHFALRKGGFLLLGKSEMIGNADDRFRVVSKPERLYQHITNSQPGEFSQLLGNGSDKRPPPAKQGRPPSRQALLAEICHQLIAESHAPAALLTNRSHECLYSLGPTERYLRLVPGRPTMDIFDMAREGVRSKLRAAVEKAIRDNARVVVDGCRINHNGTALTFDIDIRPVAGEGEDLFFIRFIETPKERQESISPTPPQDLSRVEQLERELAATKSELQDAIRNLERSNDAQKAISEEALSVNEEFQATNEELLASKEELQSLNEELTALNSQLLETLERQRTTSNDLKNVLYSTDVATLFLDTSLNIRFFTPAIQSQFHLIPADIGRPISDLHSLAYDNSLMADAQTVLKTLDVVENEIDSPDHRFFIRRILPYRNQDGGVEGVVVTYSDITEQKRIADQLTATKKEAEEANAAKSRFLAAASHDLRQPLQTFALIKGLLAKTVKGETAQNLVGRLEETLAAMSSMLDTLLDLNQIEAGNVHADLKAFPVNKLLEQLKNEFNYLAQSKGVGWRVVQCSGVVHSDPKLLDMMVRNLLTNAFKYTSSGKILLGCRRRGETLNIEVWDTGIGIPPDEMETIFEEYYQVNNSARERGHGLGLGLAIVQRLSHFLDHKVTAHSHQGNGSVFAIEVPLASRDSALQLQHSQDDKQESMEADDHRSGTILVVEDDPENRDLLELAIKDMGHRIISARDGLVAEQLIKGVNAKPDLIVADYNLPAGLNGLEFAVMARKRLHREVPAIILTGDISSETRARVEKESCILLKKPVQLSELTRTIQRLLSSLPSKENAGGRHPAKSVGASSSPIVYIVDDDNNVLQELKRTLEGSGHTVEAYSSAEAFLEEYSPGRDACVLIDAYLPGISGLDLLEELGGTSLPPTTVMITGNSDVSMAVKAMKAGASDFIEKPVNDQELIRRVEEAIARSRKAHMLTAWQEDAARAVGKLTPRQREIMKLILAGHPNKNIAADLGISQRTVESHRASIMHVTGVKSLPALARLALAAGEYGATEPD